MKLHFGVAALMCAAFAACSSDDSGGGSGGGGGTAGSAGSSGSAGSAGSSGSAGADSGSGGSAGAAGTAGAAGASGSDAGTDGGAGDLLSQTGLYTDTAKGTLSSGVLAYEPNFVLWSDGATKQRWVKLPAGSKIDTTDMDYWVYPVGTKLWKEFSVAGQRIETRLLEKIADPDQWKMVAYQWKTDQTDAIAVPDGVKNAAGTQHDIPSKNDCDTCHGKMKDRALSFSAIQLSHNKPGASLPQLIGAGALSAPPAGNFTLPGSAAEKAALGYLHANCGNCHNDQSFVFSLIDMRLWLDTKALGSVANTPTYKTTVNQALTASNPTPSTSRIVPGKSAESDVFFRMNERGTLTQMPPVGSEVVDASGLAAVKAWIDSL